MGKINQKCKPIIIDRHTELKAIDKSSKSEKKRQLVPVRVNDKTVIFIDKARDKEEAISFFLNRLKGTTKTERKGGRRKKH